jgi:hypothetical protein
MKNKPLLSMLAIGALVCILLDYTGALQYGGFASAVLMVIYFVVLVRGIL